MAAVPAVTVPPQSFFAKVRERDREAARTFYKTVVAAAEVADDALQHVDWRFKRQ
jgi:hypothetical protein